MKDFIRMHGTSAKGNDGGVNRPVDGIFETYPLIQPAEFENADTASAKKWGGRRVVNQDKKALIIHPEFPLGYE